MRIVAALERKRQEDLTETLDALKQYKKSAPFEIRVQVEALVSIVKQLKESPVVDNGRER